MLTIKGRLKGGVIYPTEHIAANDEEEVLITFLNEQVHSTVPRPVQETDYDALSQLLEECQMDTGIEDLAHQHDHYIHGTPKRVDV